MRAILRSTLRPNERLVALAYAEQAGKWTRAALTYDELSRRTGIAGRATISASLKGLVVAGWLDPVSPSRQHSSVIYELVILSSSVAEPLDNGQQFSNGTPEDASSSGAEPSAVQNPNSSTTEEPKSSSSGDDLMISDAAFIEQLQARHDVTWPTTEIQNVSARLRNALGGDRARARAFLTYLAENRIIKKSLAGYFSVIHNDDEVRAKVSAALDKKPGLPPIPHCGQCNETTRRLEDTDGADLGACPRCHWSIRLVEGAA